MKEKQGNLAKTGMPRLLHLIYRKGDPAAILDIVREPIKKRFYFKDGRPVAATSNILNEVLGRLLMQEGVITQKDYETSLELVLKEKKKHGQVLISMGLITPEELDSFLTLQLKRRLWKIFGWNEGAYRYTRADSLPEGLPRLPLNPAPLILEGISLGFYPNSRIKSDLKGYLETRLKASDGLGGYSIEDFHLNLQEKRFLESFDGTRTLKEAADGSDLLRHRALSLALTFIVTGAIAGEAAGERGDEEEFFEEELKEAEVVEGAAAPGETRLNAELLFMRAKSALQKKEYPQAIGILREITDLNPVEGEYWAYLGWAIYNENPGNIKQAEKILKDAIDLNNELDSAWYFLGMIFLETGNTDWAERSFRASISKNPWMLDSLAELKKLEIRKGLGPEISQEKKEFMEEFGFLEDPFAGSAPSRGELPLPAGCSSAVDFLSRCVKKKSGPLLLEGPTGSGKTTAALELLKRLSGEKVLAAMVLRPHDRELSLIKAINAEVGASTDAASIKEQLLGFGMRVSQNKIQGGHTLLIIDQAHLLTDGNLKLIQYLSRLKTLQILLVADSLAGRLKNPDFKELDQKITCRFLLKPLSFDETREYLLKRLQAAPKKKDAPEIEVSEGALKAIYGLSGGIPARINSAAPSVLKKPGAQEAPIEKAPAEFTPEALFTPEVPEAPASEGSPRPDEGAALEAEAPSEEKKEEKKETTEKEPSRQGIEETFARAESKEEAGTFEAAPYAPSHPSTPSPTPPPALAVEEGPEARPRKRGLLVFLLLILLMLVSGLVIGSLIGKYWSSWQKPVETAPLKTEPHLSGPQKDLSAPIDSSINATGGIDGTSAMKLEGTD